MALNGKLHPNSIVPARCMCPLQNPEGRVNGATVRDTLSKKLFMNSSRLFPPCPQNPEGQVIGATVRDTLSGKQHTVYARTVVNAAGPFSDEVRALSQVGRRCMGSAALLCTRSASPCGQAQMLALTGPALPTHTLHPNSTRTIMPCSPSQ